MTFYRFVVSHLGDQFVPHQIELTFHATRCLHENLAGSVIVSAGKVAFHSGQFRRQFVEINSISLAFAPIHFNTRGLDGVGQPDKKLPDSLGLKRIKF